MSVPPRPTDQRAIASMVCAVVGLGLPVVLSVAAIALALRARPALRADPALGGRGLAAVGLWVGLLGAAEWAYIGWRLATG